MAFLQLSKFLPQKNAITTDHWGRGNGWVYAALVRVMDAMLISKQAQAPGFDEPLGKNKWKN